MERAVAVLAGRGAPADRVAYALAAHGSLLALTERPEAALSVLRRGPAELAAACGPGRPRRDLPELRGRRARRPATAQPGLADLRASLELARRSGTHECVARGYTNLAEPLYRLGHLDELAALLDDGLAFTRERGFWSHAYNLDVHRCLLLLRRGDWDEAEEGLRDLAADADVGMLYVYSVPPYARLLARRGGREAERCWTRRGSGRWRSARCLGLAFTGTAVAEWAWLTGRPERAARWPPRCCCAAGDRRRGRAGASGRCCATWTGPAAGASLPGCPEPWAAGLRGDWRAAADGWAAVGDPYERALELAGSGEVEADAGGAAAARRPGRATAAAALRPGPAARRSASHGCRAARTPRPAPTPPGSPTASSTCSRCSPTG